MSKHQNQKNQYVNQYMAEKAGMESVDKQKIAELIQKITEGTPKSLYQKQISQKRQLQLADMARKILQFSYQQKKDIKNQWIPEIQKMKENRNLNKYWAHLDFDMFYVACEMLDQPELRQKPVAVGGDFSVICTANYVARKYGVRSALPTFIAKKLCSSLILIPPDFSKYKKYSNIFRDILRKFDKDLQSMGLDEAYVQLTDFLKDKSSSEQQEFINSIRQQIFDKTGLTVSCGVGANKMLAKLASEQKKPNGQFLLQNSEHKIIQFMQSKKIRKIPGIGPVNQFFLKGLGVQTAGDILTNTDILSICFSSNSVEFYISTALGLGGTQHQFTERKSVGKSQTFKATNDLSYLFQKMYEICEQVSMQLDQLGYVSKNVVFSYQTQMYSKKDKSFQLNKYTSAKQDLVQQILPYLKDYVEINKQKIRLLGARCSSIIKVEQLRKIQLDKYFVKPGTEIIFEGDQQGMLNSKNIGVVLMTYFCPICNEQIECKGNLALFNRHIDKCMSEEPNERKDIKSDKVLSQKTSPKQNIKQKEQTKDKQRNKNNKESAPSNNGNLLSFFKKKE